MSVISQDRVKGISERVRSGDYQVDPAAVADAIVRQMVWEDVPDVASMVEDGERERQSPRLRGLVRVRNLVTPPQLNPRTVLRF